MTIWGTANTGSFTPDELTLGLGDYLKQTAGAAAHEWPLRRAVDIAELQAASGERDDLGGMIERVQAGESTSDVVDRPSAVPELAIADARTKVKEAGLDKILTLPDQPSIRQPAFDIMLKRAEEKRERDAVLARGPSGVTASLLSVGTSFLVGAVDPLNIASAFIPVIGEARYAKLLADAGTGFAARAAVRAPVGAAAGAVGSIPMIGLEARARFQEGQDYTMAEALQGLIFGSVLGGTLHSGGGAVADILRARKGTPLYPFAPGEPFERPANFSRESAEPPGRPPVSEPAPGHTEVPPEADFAAGDSLPQPRPILEGPVSPIVRALDDLPPRAKEDAYRAGIADLVEGRPVAVGEMLQAAAKGDPRIAESLALADRPNLIGLDEERIARAIAAIEPFKLPELAARGGKPANQNARLPGEEQVFDILQAARDGRNLAEAHPRMLRASDEQVAQLRDIAAGKTDEDLRAIAMGVADRPSLEPATIPAARGPRARDPETWSLNEFLASRGGIDPTDPLISDLRGSIGTSNKFVPGFGHLIRKGGMRLDQAREAAIEAGYLRDHGADAGRESTTTISTLLDAMDHELRGNRVYREGREPVAGLDAAQNRIDIEREAVGSLRDEGIDPQGVPDKTMARVVEIMEREGERDALHAYERAVMEETHYGAETGLNQRIAEPIPEWNVPDDAGAASRPGGAVARGGERGAGAAARQPGGGDRAAARAAALVDDFRALADRPHFSDDPEALAASRAAEALSNPESWSPDVQRRVAAIEKLAAEADERYRESEAALPAELKAKVDAALHELDGEAADRAEIIRRGAACLTFGAAGAAA